MTAKKQEWSHFIESVDIDHAPMELELKMPTDSASALCNRLNLKSIEKLHASLVLRRNDVTKVIHIKGRLEADINQTCIITSEAIPEHIEDNFEAWFADPSEAVSFEKARRERISKKEKDDLPIMEESDDPEPVIDGLIDLGELVTQHLSLALNPYPRKQGANLGLEIKEDRKDDYEYSNPFAKLKDWKNKN